MFKRQFDARVVDVNGDGKRDLVAIGDDWVGTKGSIRVFLGR